VPFTSISVQKCWAKTILLSQTGMFLTFLHPTLMCRLTYLTPLGMLFYQIHSQLVSMRVFINVSIISSSCLWWYHYWASHSLGIVVTPSHQLANKTGFRVYRFCKIINPIKGKSKWRHFTLFKEQM
jgi:hypothetical protein